MKSLRHRLYNNTWSVIAVLGVVVGIMIGYPLGNRTVTKTVTHTKTIKKNVSAQLNIGETENQMALVLGSKRVNGGTKTVGTKTMACFVYYGQVDSKGVPQDWYATVCGI